MAFIFVSNDTDKTIRAYYQDEYGAYDQYEDEYIKPFPGDFKTRLSTLRRPANLMFCYDGADPNRSGQPTITVNENEETFTMTGIPSDVVLYLGHLEFVPGYDDGEHIPAQSGTFPFSKDQLGNLWCMFEFYKASDFIPQ